MRRREGGKSGDTPDLVTTDEAASYLTVTAAAVRAWRVRGGGPSYVKVGSAVRYRRSDLDSWLEGQRVVR